MADGSEVHRATGRRFRRLYAAIGAIVATAAVTAGIAYAIASPPVGTDLAAIGYRNIVDTGDLFFLVRYELPVQTTPLGTPVTTPEAWCAELLDTEGCTGSSAIPDEATSLRDAAVFVTLYTDTAGTVVAEQTQIARIGHALTGVYIFPGSSLTFGDTDYRICIEPSPLIYSPATRRCTSISWNGAAAPLDDQREQLGTDLIVQLQALELLRNVGTNQYVINNKATTAGKILALDALPIIDRIIPEFFQIGAIQAIGTVYPTTVVGSLPLQQQLESNAVATGLKASFDNAGQTLMGNGTVWTAMVSIALSGGVAWIVMIITKNTGTVSMPLTVITFLTGQLIMMWILWPTVSVMSVTLFLLSIPASWYMLRRSPAG